jgi:hypothetical protein
MTDRHQPNAWLDNLSRLVPLYVAVFLASYFSDDMPTYVYGLVCLLLGSCAGVLSTRRTGD